MFVKKRPGNLIHIIGIVAILFLTYVLLFRSPESTESEEPVAANPVKSPRERLEFYLNDAMNYGLPYPRRLAETYIADARKIEEEHPEIGPFARTVVDSLNSRLRRKAAYPY